MPPFTTLAFDNHPLRLRMHSVASPFLAIFTLPNISYILLYTANIAILYHISPYLFPKIPSK